jgi:hypothetical protein
MVILYLLPLITKRDLVVTKGCKKDYVAGQRQAAHIYAVVFLIRFSLPTKLTQARQTKYKIVITNTLTTVGRMINNRSFSLLHLREARKKCIGFNRLSNHTCAYIVSKLDAYTYTALHVTKITALSS